MTTRFVSAVDGSDLDDGLSWANAKATVAGALADALDGDIIKVDSAGTYTANAGINWSFPTGSIAVISVDRANSDAWTAGAKEKVGAASGLCSMSGANGSNIFSYGMEMHGGTNNSGACDVQLFSTTGANIRLECLSCNFQINSVNTSAQIVFGTGPLAQSAQTSIDILLRDCTFTCGASRAGTLMSIGEVDVEIINPTIVLSGATKPDTLIEVGAQSHKLNFIVRDGDLSGFNAAGCALVDVTNFADGKMLFKNLKLGSNATLKTGTWPNGNGAITARNVSGSDEISVFEFHNGMGDLVETTSVYATSGAEFAGAGIGWQITTSADCSEANPFVIPALFKWNETTTAQTATVEIANNSATALTDRDIWLNLSYPDSASFPSYSNDSDRNANPFTGTAADQTTSANGWTGLGGANTQQKLTVSFTAAEKGLLEGRVYVGKASQTLFLDPNLKAA